MKITQKLIDKAEKTFEGRGMILTGQGLSRKELRVLDRHGIVKSTTYRNKDKGSIIRGWRLIRSGFVKENA